MCHSLAQLAENIYFQKLPMTGFELQTLMLVVVDDAVVPKPFLAFYA